ncbi:MAG: thiolase family protein [Candidatus Binatia bacterium]
MKDVAVLGVGMYRFGMWADVPTSTMLRIAGMEALKDAGISFRDVGTANVGYIFDKVMAGTRGMKELGLTGIPIVHIESASATGSVAFREACRAVASGEVEIAMAVGMDKMTEMIMRSDAGMRSSEMDDVILPAGFFAMWATRRMHERGTKPEHLAKLAAKNWNHGAKNPMSQRQATETVTAEKVLGSRMVAWPLTAMMSCPIGDGAAVAIVGRKELAKKLRPDRPVVSVVASTLRTETYEKGHLFQGPVVGPPQMSRDASKAIYDEAGIGPKDVDLAQCHDAFAIEELEYYELLGFCAPGEAEGLIERGDTSLGGKIPFSTDGGLIARGHPGGPTGLAQLWETTLQLRGEAGPRQVDGARVGLCHMMGGGSVCCMHMLVRE